MKWPLSACLLFIVVWGLNVEGFDTFLYEHFDYFIFVHQWPTTLCKTASSDEDCKVPLNCTGWAIHGLWPTIYGEVGPNYCNNSVAFDWQQIEKLIPELVQQWPNCFQSTGLFSFWAHEYTKHGTCCMDIMETEYDFFSTVLNLNKAYNMTRFMDLAGIYPSSTVGYSLTELQDRIGKVTVKKPRINCADDGRLLYQVYLCMAKNFTLMDCPSMSNLDCYSDTPIYYLPRVT